MSVNVAALRVCSIGTAPHGRSRLHSYRDREAGKKVARAMPATSGLSQTGLPSMAGRYMKYGVTQLP